MVIWLWGCHFTVLYSSNYIKPHTTPPRPHKKGEQRCWKAWTWGWSYPRPNVDSELLFYYSILWAIAPTRTLCPLPIQGSEHIHKTAFTFAISFSMGERLPKFKQSFQWHLSHWPQAKLLFTGDNMTPYFAFSHLNIGVKWGSEYHLTGFNGLHQRFWGLDFPLK